MRMRFQNPFDRQSVRVHMMQDMICVDSCSRSRLFVEVENGVNYGAMSGFWISNDILHGTGSLVEKCMNVRLYGGFYHLHVPRLESLCNFLRFWFSMSIGAAEISPGTHCQRTAQDANWDAPFLFLPALRKKASIMPNPTKPRILCVGALTMDTIFRLDRLPPGPGKFIPVEALHIAAGMASSAAASIARLGGGVSLWASIGDDDIGRRVVEDLTAEGVDCSSVRRIDAARSAFSSIFVDAAGERMIVPFYDAALLTAPQIMPPIAEGAYDVVMTDVRWPLAAAQALKAARGAGVHGVLDADTAPLETLEMLLPLASHIVASEPAAEQVTGESDPERATVALAALYGRDGAFIAVTGGDKGCFWYDALEGEVRNMPAFAVDVVDTLAAGDVFHGVFTWALSRGHPTYQIMRFASAAAAIKCSRFGGRRGAPTKSELEAFLTR